MPATVSISFFQQDLYDREGNMFVISKVQYDGTNGTKFAVPNGGTGGTAPAVFSPAGVTPPTATIAASQTSDAISGAAAGVTDTVSLASGQASGQVYVVSMHPGRSPGGSR